MTAGRFDDVECFTVSEESQDRAVRQRGRSSDAAPAGVTESAHRGVGGKEAVSYGPSTSSSRDGDSA